MIKHSENTEPSNSTKPVLANRSVSCVALGYEDIKVLWKGNITLLEMIGFMRDQKRATPKSVEDSQRIASKELDRKYSYDFEVYGEKSQNGENSEVEIFIATK